MSAVISQVRESNAISEAERQLRIDLSACYRLIDYFGWADIMATHVSARIPGTEHFLANPQGMLFDEITASSFVKINAQGQNVAGGDYGVNRAAFAFHSAAHRLCEEAAVVIHTHTVPGMAVSAHKDGLLPITIQSLGMQGELGYYDGKHLPAHPGQYEQIAADLGNKRMLIMRNHGLLAAGRTTGEAFMAIYRLEQACAVQLAAQNAPAGYYPMSEEVVNGAAERSQAFHAKALVPVEWPALVRKIERLDPSFKN
jgi:ribulose-5-phosphate 4-epimerase/fuculose-1-phosphate aldolase